jgi:antitoxin component of RelBE/YafQ-DinJ toxin-antitoxin module
MPAHKTFFDRYVTAVSVERQEWKIAQALGIKLSDAVRLGLNFMIKDRIIDSDRRLTPEILEQFKEIETRDLQDLERYIRLKKEEQTTLDKMVETRKEATKEEEMVEVYDKDEESYITITKRLYAEHPEWYVLKRGVPG